MLNCFCIDRSHTRFLSVPHLPKREPASLWQTTWYQEFLLASGGIERSLLYTHAEQEEIRAYAFVEIRRISMGFLGAFITGGPVCTHPEIAEVFLEKIRSQLIREKVLFVQIEPLQAVSLGESWRIGAYKTFIEPWTIRLDLSKDQETLFAQCHEKGRYEIRSAQKNGVEIISLPVNKGSIDIFHALLAQTAERDHFSVHTRDYLTTFLASTVGSGHGEILAAQKDGVIVAVGVFVWHGGETYYYYGASSSDSEHRKLRAPYLLQWTAIQHAIAR